MSDISAERSSDTGSPLSASLPCDPSRPVLSALSEAAVQKWNFVLDLVRKIAESIPGEAGRFAALGPEIVQALEEWRELLRWAVPYREPFSQEEADRSAAALIAAGVPPLEAVKYGRMSIRRHPGAPPRRRQDVIAAYEAQLARPHTTWNELAQQFCRCEKERHDRNCQETLRRGVGHLKNILRKYAIQVHSATPGK